MVVAKTATKEARKYKSLDRQVKAIGKDLDRGIRAVGGVKYYNKLVTKHNKKKDEMDAMRDSLRWGAVFQRLGEAYRDPPPIRHHVD